MCSQGALKYHSLLGSVWKVDTGASWLVLCISPRSCVGVCARALVRRIRTLRFLRTTTPLAQIWFENGQLKSQSCGASGPIVCLNPGFGKPTPPCGPGEQYLATQVTVDECDVPATSGWTREVVQ